MSWYCEVAPGHPVHAPYHDDEYGFPASDETVLFERLSLEIFQAGLSWLLVLNKRAALNLAFAGFSVDRVASFGEDEVARLLADASIIRNRAKVRAVIANAARIQAAARGGRVLRRMARGASPARARRSGSSCSARPSRSPARRWSASS